MANWWKYGLCVFGGLGVGYAVGVRLTKDRAEAEVERKIADIREIYRNDRKTTSAKKKPAAETQPKIDELDITSKTSIDMALLSEKRAQAAQARNKYSEAFKDKDKPVVKSDEEIDKEMEEDWSSLIQVVPKIPDDSPNRKETLKYYQDGIVAYAVNGAALNDQEIKERIGEEALRLFDHGGYNQVYVQNNALGIDYTILFDYNEYAQVIAEEPYKAEQ